MRALRDHARAVQPRPRRAPRPRSLVSALAALAPFALCCLVGAAALAGAASAANVGQAAALGKPTPAAPAGYVAPLKPTFTWSAVRGAAGYELRVLKGRTLLLDKTGIGKPSWLSGEALPMNVSLTWQVRATAAAGPGPWSDGLEFQIGAAGFTDYANAAHWLSAPADPTKKVDVFYLYPTSYVKPAPDAPIVCPVDDPGMIKGAGVAFERQAWAFRTFANIYAPYYRQADSASRAALPQAQQDQIVAGAPTQRRHRGLRLLHQALQPRAPVHPGRALAGLERHGQPAGEVHEGASPGVYKRMVAAYVVGYSITPRYLSLHPFLKFATGANDTGVIISWNTEAPTVDGTNPVLLPGGLVINPITWTRKQTEATAAQNLGSIELDPSTGGTPMMNTQTAAILRVMSLADARIDKARGVVICTTIDPTVSPYYTPGGFPQGVLHPFDYPFYFFDVRANAANRVTQYFADHPEAR